MKIYRGAIGGVVLAVAIVISVVCCLMCIERIPTGYVGVVYNLNGGVVGEVLTQGWHLVAPTKKVTEYSVGIEQSYLTAEEKGDSDKDESFSTPTSDGKSLQVDLEFSYRFDVNNITDTFTKFKGISGAIVKDTFIKPKMVAWTQEVTAKYPVTDVFGDKRQELNTDLDNYLKKKFKPYGIIIDTVNFTNISTDAETQQAIQRKVNAQQELELAQIETKTAQVNANKAKIEAQGQSDALIIKAKGEAEANKELASSITAELIQKQYIEKWTGEVPMVSGSDNTPVIDIRGLKETTTPATETTE